MIGLVRLLAVTAGLALGAPGVTQEHGTAGQGTPQPSAGAQAQAPAAPVNSCIECHDRQAGQLKAPIAIWQDSVHGRAGVTCDGCHGGDTEDPQFAHSPSADFIGRPRLREVAYMCGKCHGEIRDRHVGSVHGKNGLPHCVSCHGAHDITRPDPTRIITEEACNKCHAFDKAKTAQDMLTKARALIDEMHAFAEQIDNIPGVQAPLENMQKELRLDHAGVVSTFHSFRIGDIQQIGSNVDRVVKTLDSLREREERRRENFASERPMILALVGFLVLAAAFGYVVYHGKHGGTPLPAKHHDHG